MSRRISFPTWTIPAALLVVVITAYGLFAPQQGIYWDDWAFVWIPAFFGKAGLIQYFSVSRPVWGYLFIPTTSLIGTSSLGWQLFALLWRWLAAVALWWTLELAWPGKRRATFFLTLLIALYPGFMEHSVAITYGHFSLVFTFFFLSLGLMLFAQGQPRYYWACTVAGALCSTLNLFSLEYYFGIELLRPILLWFVVVGLETDRRRQIQRALLAYLPYALVLGCFVLWRLFGFHSTDYQLRLSAMQSLSTLPAEVLRAVWSAGVAAWAGIVRLPPTADLGLLLSIVYFGVLAASFAGLLFYVPRLQLAENASGESPAAGSLTRQWLVLGVIGLLTAGIPFYAVGLQVRLVFPADRFTQAFAVGSAFIIMAVLELIPSVTWRSGIAAALVALAIGLQIQYAFSFRQDGKLQRAYFWQLFWRAPALQAGTALLSDNTVFPYTDDDALTMPLNWIYSPTVKSGPLPYAQIFFTVNSGGEIPLKSGSPLDKSVTAFEFHGSTDRALVLQFTPPSCLHILNPAYDSDLPLAPASDAAYRSLLGAGFPMLGRKDALALPLSNIGLIGASSATPGALAELFGPEPAHTWCYYFEKADLARQSGDWAEVARLGDAALAASLRPDDSSEYLPFVEAQARLGRWDGAKQLTLTTADAMPSLSPALCAVWQRVDADAGLSGQDHTFIGKVEARLQVCPVH